MKRSLAIYAMLLVSSFILVIASVNIFFIYVILDKSITLLLLVFFFIAVGSGITVLIISSLRILEQFHTIEKKESTPNLDYLSEDERFVFNIILKNNGSMLQNRLVTESGLSKVKISRIVNSLEAKGYVEKRRKGVTNEISIKR